MFERSADWTKQARRDISSAETVMESGFYEWTCFIAQQCAEKAVTALYQKLRVAPYGHEIGDLLRRLSTRVGVTDELMADARSLDLYYERARYPDSFDTGVPGDYIGREDAEKALISARRILKFCESLLTEKETVQESTARI